jgi:hypothetical protein
VYSPKHLLRHLRVKVDDMLLENCLRYYYIKFSSFIFIIHVKYAKSHNPVTKHYNHNDNKYSVVVLCFVLGIMWMFVHCVFFLCTYVFVYQKHNIKFYNKILNYRLCGKTYQWNVCFFFEMDKD